MLTSNGNLAKINYIKFYMKLFILKYKGQRASLAGMGAAMEHHGSRWMSRIHSMGGENWLL